MIIFSLFILFLLLENLFLPALLGPSKFFITPIFIIGLLAYTKNLKYWIFQAAILVMLEVVFTGIDPEKIAPPLALTAILYIILNRYINLSEQFRENLTLGSIVLGTVTLTLLTSIYAGLYILFDNSFEFITSWPEIKTFFLNSLAFIAGWSAVISVLLKFLRSKY